MALPSDYISGTITLTNGSTAFTGAGTGWLAADFREGDIILDVEGGEGAVAVIASITSNTAGVLSKEWEGPTLTGVAYRMRYQWDSGRVSAQSRAAIEMLGNGNLQSFASLTGPGVPVFDGPHSVTIKPESDFVNGVAYNVQVDTLADRDAYDGQSEGFAVLVSDVGDGRSALYSKESNTVGDWGAPAYITGPVGPLPEVEATVTSLPPGSTATVTPTPIAGGVRLDFDLPGASGFYNAGVYDIGSAYGTDDVVRHNGSSFIALQAVPAGTSPSNASPPVDTAYWQVLAAKGADGSGTGDVVGPSGVVADRIAVFDGTTGKLIKDGGVTVSQLVPADGSITNTKLADMETARIKGRVTAGTGVPEDLTATQVWSLLGVAPVANAYARSTILGTVSQSSGVPTGAVIESGSNANGEYVRFADGTQICWKTLASSGPINNAWGAIYISSVNPGGAWPAEFSSAPKDFITGGSAAVGAVGGRAADATATNSGSYFLIRGPSAVGSGSVDILAIGRWF